MQKKNKNNRKKVKTLALMIRRKSLDFLMIVVESLEYINLITVDIKKSVEFYTLFLDFELLEESDKHALVAFDDLKVKLSLSEDGVKSDAKQMPIFSFILDVDDFTEAIQIAEEENVPIASGPNEIESGTGESLLLKDPGGNLIELFYKE